MSEDRVPYVTEATETVSADPVELPSEAWRQATAEALRSMADSVMNDATILKVTLEMKNTLIERHTPEELGATSVVCPKTTFLIEFFREVAARGPGEYDVPASKDAPPPDRSMSLAEYNQQQWAQRLDRRLQAGAYERMVAYLAEPTLIFGTAWHESSGQVLLECRICQRTAAGAYFSDLPNGKAIALERAAHFLKQGGCPHGWVLALMPESKYE